MATYQELRARSQQVRDEQNIGGNTALRVGQLLMDIVKYFNDNDAAASEYLQQHFAMVNDGTHLLNWQQSPIVILHTMGDDYDDGDFSALSQGENYYRAGFIMEANGQSGGINGETPKANVLYVNLANDTLYTWNGSSFDAITSGGGGSISGDDILKNAYYSNGNLVLVFETESGDKTVTIPVNFDASNYVPTSRTVNGKALSNNITLSQSDIPGLVAALAAKIGYSDDEWLQVKAGAMQAATAVQNTTTVNGKRLNNNIVIGMADIPGLLQAIANAGSGAVSVQQNADGSFSITVGNDTYVFDDFPTKQDMADAIDDALGEAQVTVVPEGSVGVISSLGSDSDEDALAASMGKKLRVAITTILNSLGNYAFPDGKPVIDWSDDTPLTYTVQKTIGTGLSATGGDTNVNDGDPLEVTIAITNNMYIVDDDSVVVTMGGSPVACAWNASTMKVTIAAVTGNVAINVPSLTYVGYGEQNSPLVFNLDGFNRGGVAGHWTDMAGNVDFVLTNCTENSDNVEFNGTSSKGVSSGSLNVRYDEGTIESIFDVSASDYPTNIQCILTNNMEYGISIGLGKGANPDTSKSLYCYVNALASSTTPNTGVLGFDNVIKTKQQVCFYKLHGYRNGVALNDALPTNGIVFGVDSTTQLALGTRHRSSSDNYMKGKIFMVRVYNRVLTDSERAQNYKVDKKRYNLS